MLNSLLYMIEEKSVTLYDITVSCSIFCIYMHLHNLEHITYNNDI